MSEPRLEDIRQRLGEEEVGVVSGLTAEDDMAYVSELFSSTMRPASIKYYFVVPVVAQKDCR
jgi:hypothetical protein